MKQFLRKVGLVVTSQPDLAATLAGLGTTGLDLSDLQIRFSVNQADTETPNIAIIRVYNPSEQTLKTVIREYDTVVLQAGYEEGNFGIIFRGTIKQFKVGRERNVDNYLDLLAADGDLGYNFGIVNRSMPAGTTPLQQFNNYAEAMGFPLASGTENLLGGVILNPRGKVAFGLARTYLRDMALTQGARWSIQDGVVTLIPLTGYLPGDAVQVNSATGLIGIPEATNEGITFQTLLNPLLKVGNRVQINNKDVNQTIVREQFFPQYRSGPTLVSNITFDGYYRVLAIDHDGDTRGQEWYSTVTCLSLDPSAKVESSVQGFGG